MYVDLSFAKIIANKQAGSILYCTMYYLGLDVIIYLNIPIKYVPSSYPPFSGPFFLSLSMYNSVWNS